MIFIKEWKEYYFIGKYVYLCCIVYICKLDLLNGSGRFYFDKIVLIYGFRLFIVLFILGLG